ncbi:MAG TPA: vitamin K epoxide reductase family protein, partial [Pyrinomonadaceae bacterium]|nr:vitamin K epoxide reductase family protein [Pyrinomonadaceae bacterium]
MTEIPETNVKQPIAKLPVAAAIVALAGLADAIFLTIHHYNAEPVPCGGPFDCEMVLAGPYGTLSGFIGNVPVIGDVPLSMLGAAAYFIAFCFAILAAFGDRRTWPLFGIQSTL